jgi:alkanesulfonate monooxygenase SsuD/methylene tetrahydromethanopterin reductase-like flavin-dependent oxidoreductase (luciferase family)
MLSFGVDVPAATPVDPVAAARRAEALGYDFVSMSDHPSGTTPSNEVWTALCFMAAHTTRIRFMPRVLGVPYRWPAMVAKMSETLDRLSGGRLILGLGGGASDEEFRAFGIGVPSARDKVDGLAEAIEIIRGLWTVPAMTYAGRLHHVVDAPMEPKPARPVPIWLGTVGPRALALAGQVADGWIPSLGYAARDRLPDMRAAVARAAERAGRSVDDVTCALNLEVRVGEGDRLVESLVDFVAVGFTAFNLKPAGPGYDDQVEWLARDIVPAARAAL